MARYKGYQGGIIDTVGMATAWHNNGENEKVVIYKLIDAPELFTMPEKDFNGMVEDENKHRVKRWTLIEEVIESKKDNPQDSSLEVALKKWFGHDSFRGSQREVVEAIVNGRDTVCVMPTGAGKSLCYQLPALVLDGITIVVCPLISLMKDQVDYLKEKRIPAEYLHKDTPLEERKTIEEKLVSGKCKILFVSPERLQVDSFKKLSLKLNIRFIAIDEAHCISEWGNKFKPAYRKIREYIDYLKKRPIVGAFTATATGAVKKDIENNLGMKNPFSITTGFDRPNLKYSVFFPKNRDDMLLSILASHKGESGIIYCTTKKDVDRINNLLHLKGFDSVAYHADINSKEKTKNQEEFIQDIKKIVVATTAFGMGIDKADVRVVINYNMPDSIETYYQEAGRAGRDGNPAECILLYGPKDVVTNQQMMQKDTEKMSVSEQEKEKIQKGNEERLKQMTFYATCNDCLRRRILTYFGDPAELHCDNCSNCLGKYKLVDITEDAKRIIECLKESGQCYGMDKIADTLKGSNSKEIRKRHLDELHSYGSISEKDKITICHEMRTLINAEYLRQEGEYNIIKVNPSAKDITEGKVKVTARAYDNITVNHHTATNQAPNTPSAAAFNQQLYNELSDWRKGVAEQIGQPAFCVFHNSTLQAIASAMPTSEKELLNVNGVGPAKYDKYGEALIEIIKKYK